MQLQLQWDDVDWLLSVQELFLFLKQHTVSSSSDQPKFNILKVVVIVVANN